MLVRPLRSLHKGGRKQQCREGVARRQRRRRKRRAGHRPCVLREFPGRSLSRQLGVIGKGSLTPHIALH
ncbi:hypothetical protein E2C01_041132 [Portunus trituberculatus]|uniref:Uncharacterized protein n=1 Tax=Portunus trituberculatus TaxID=210409 RepID=A0A5B7FR30_PORTR|nr:hypothetical protein [Portunus trituberculatus]